MSNPAPYVPGPSQLPNLPAPADAPRRRIWLIIAIAVAAIAGLVVAILIVASPQSSRKSSGAAGVPAVASAGASTPPTPVHYVSAADLRAALLAHGVPCANPETISHSEVGPPGVTGDSISCAGYSGELDLDIYDTQDNTEGRLSYQQALLAGVDDSSWFVIGDRWTVQAESQSDALQVAAAIGGDAKPIKDGGTAVTAAAAAAVVPLTAADIELTVKIKKKDCFGSAGCNVEYTIKAAIGKDVDPQECEVTYDVHGLEDTQTGTLDFHTDGTYEQDSFQYGDTTSSKKKLTAKVTDVDCS